MRLLLVEPWFAGSHAGWASGFGSASVHDVRLATLPGETWRTRLRSGALELLPVIESAVDDGWMPDLLLVSGMVDVAALAGLLGTTLGSPPIVVYQHESQISYPNQSGSIDVEASIHNINSWLVADSIWFNSAYHLATVRSALARHAGDVGLVASTAALHALQCRSLVMPVGVDLAWVDQQAPPVSTSVPGPLIVWPHRWDWDKRPDVFLRALRKLAAANTDFGLVLAGRDGSQSHVRTEIEVEFASQVVAVGPFSIEEYRRWLKLCDVVVSCAEHEFFGIGVVEALAAGCVGVLPNALSYPEIVGPSGEGSLYDGRSFGTALGRVVTRQFGRVHQLAARSGTSTSVGCSTAEAVRRFDWSALGPTYDAALERIRTGVRPPS